MKSELEISNLGWIRKQIRVVFQIKKLQFEFKVARFKIDKLGYKIVNDEFKIEKRV